MAKEKIIQNPKHPQHFMRLVPSDNPTGAFAQDIEVASSTKTLRLFEVGKSEFPEVIYFPKKDVRAELLKPSQKSTHCPLKGDTAYFHVQLQDTLIENAAWQYAKPLSFAKLLEDYIAFDKTKVRIVEN